MTTSFHTASIRELVPAPDAAFRHGFFRARFVGPSWFRVVDERTMLGMTTLDLPLLRRLAFLFLLERE